MRDFQQKLGTMCTKKKHCIALKFESYAWKNVFESRINDFGK